MNALLILSALLAGQCGPRGCPAPSFAATPMFRPAVLQAPAYRPAPAAAIQPNLCVDVALGLSRPYYVVKDHSVRHDGLTFTVRGYKNDAGRITWDTSEPGNRKAWDDAKARRAALASAVRPEPVPTAAPGPALTGDDKPVTQVAGQALNYGMEPGRMKVAPTYTLPSPEARRFAQEAKFDPGGPAKLHVTVIGTDDERAPVMNDLLTSPSFAGLKPTMMVQGYTRDEWPVDPALGFVTTGKPTILVQTAKGPTDPKGGRVVYRASDYSMGPAALAEEIRKANPDYKPSVDPGPATGKPSAVSCPFGFTKDHWPYILAVGVVLAGVIKLPRKGA